MRRFRWTAFLAAGLALWLVPATAQTAVTIDGRKVPLATIEKDGKVFVDAVALAAALGVKATYNQGGKALAIRTVAAATPAPSTAQGGGTPQLPGENASFAQLYMLGKDRQWLFSLKSVGYTVARMRIGDELYTPAADEKLLVARFTVQNAAKEETALNWATFHFTAVDANNVNREYTAVIGDERNSGAIDMALKPAQKVDAYAVFVVPAKGVVPKLIVLPNDRSPVLRYDLRGKAPALPEPIADPADTAGYTARTNVPAKAGVYYPFAAFDAKLDKAEYSTNALGDEELEDGHRLVVLTVTAKNLTDRDQHLAWGTFFPELRTADGERLDWNSRILLPRANRDADLNVRVGEEASFRYFFQIPQDAKAKTFLLREGESRTYEFELTM